MTQGIDQIFGGDPVTFLIQEFSIRVLISSTLDVLDLYKGVHSLSVLFL